MANKYLGTNFIKSLSINLPIYLNSIYHFFSISKILIYFSSLILKVLSFETSNLRAELTPSKFSYFWDFEKINNIIEYLKDRTSFQDLNIRFLAYKTKL